MKKLLVLLALVSIAAPAFAADEKPPKSGSDVKKEIDQRNAGAKGLNEGKSTVDISTATGIAKYALVEGDTRTNLTGDELDGAIKNIAKAIVGGVVSGDALIEITKGGRTGIDQQIAVEMNGLIADAALKNQLNSKSAHTTNGRKETISLLSYLESEGVKAINDPNYKGDKQKVLNFVRDWREAVRQGKSLEDGAKEAVSKLGKSWDEFCKLCLKV